MAAVLKNFLLPSAVRPSSKQRKMSVTSHATQSLPPSLSSSQGQTSRAREEIAWWTVDEGDGDAVHVDATLALFKIQVFPLLPPSPTTKSDGRQEQQVVLCKIRRRAA